MLERWPNSWPRMTKAGQQMARNLSRRQQAMLEYIERFLEDNNYPPTIREIQR
ncbi:MAG TPA: hypothetical protein VNE17_13145, partial [Nitrolancea sp.]|nr:hypothetical protein [Nitrolancea sp.]